jgi:hypothetical protein
VVLPFSYDFPFMGDQQSYDPTDETPLPTGVDLSGVAVTGSKLVTGSDLKLLVQEGVWPSVVDVAHNAPGSPPSAVAPLLTSLSNRGVGGTAACVRILAADIDGLAPFLTFKAKLSSEAHAMGLRVASGSQIFSMSMPPRDSDQTINGLYW